ncbi:MAG: glycosyltransferase [Waltera sp.]|uniref:glycosyltransferase n=2 Tax=Waltera sp. TaxID=2815806 RepID=UPI0039924918
MNKEHILLSISMLISGRDEMEKSLNSLLYFKNAFPTEIILVDTGCNEKQRALAEQYADKIINFTWCNDFGAARNAGLKKAQGEWFMYLDDDEWFENPQEIISFFTTGEYRKYNSASYIVRNYMDPYGNNYVDSYPSRMVKLNSTIHFVGKIHEYLDPFLEPRKEFNNFVHHYGYVYKNEQERIKHAWRNIQPLLEIRKEYPGDPRWIMQLDQEYFCICNYENVIAASIEGLKEWEKYRKKLTYMPIHIGAIYAYLLLAFEGLGRYQEEEEWLKRASSEPLNELDTMEICIAFYNMMGARVYGCLDNDDLCIEYYKKYKSNYNKLKSDRTAMESKTAGAVTDVFSNIYFAETFMMCLPAFMKRKEWKIIQENILIVDWKQIESFSDDIKNKKVLETMCTTEYHGLYTELAEKMLGDGNYFHTLYPTIQALQKEYELEGKKDEIHNLCHIVATLPSKHFYIITSKILWKNAQKESGIEECYEELFLKYADNILEIEDNIWDIAEERKIEIELFFMQMDYRTWRRALESMEHWGSSEDWDKWNSRIREWKSSEDIRYDLFDIKYMGSNLARITKKTESLPELENQLWMYADMVYEFYQPYYREDVLQDNSIGLPDELQLALELRELRDYRKSGQERNTLETMKKCLGVYPKLDKTMLVYAEMLRDEIKKQSVEVNEAKKELLQMASTLKEMAKKQITLGNVEAAKQILLQTQQYVPEDEEIRNILKDLDTSSHS